MSKETACASYPPDMTIDYVSLRVGRSARDSLQRLQLQWSAEVGRRLTLTEVIDAAALVAERHRGEVVKSLAR